MVKVPRPELEKQAAALVEMLAARGLSGVRAAARVLKVNPAQVSRWRRALQRISPIAFAQLATIPVKRKRRAKHKPLGSEA